MEKQDNNQISPTSKQVSQTLQEETITSKKITNRIVPLLLVIILLLLGLTAFLSYLLLRKTNLTKQITSETTAPADFENEETSTDTEVSYNTNKMVNPTTIAGLLNWTRGSYVFSYKSENKDSSKVYTSTNGKFSFKYPADINVYEFPDQYSDNTNILITSNQDEFSYIEELQNCLENKPPQSESTCDLPTGDNFVMTISQPYDQFFLVDSTTFPKQISTIAINDNRVVSLFRVTAFIEEPIKLSSQIESQVRLGVIDRPYFEYRIKLNESFYKENPYLRFGGYAYPSTYPYRQALSTILDTFKTN